MIKDIIIKKLNIIPDERGEIMHMLKSSDSNFQNLVKYILQLLTPELSKVGIYIKHKSKITVS